jgi:hypothetical protein
VPISHKSIQERHRVESAGKTVVLCGIKMSKTKRGLLVGDDDSSTWQYLLMPAAEGTNE